MSTAELELPASLHSLVGTLEIALPMPDDSGDIEQDEEWIVVRVASGWRKIRLHDYHDVFAVPGLYEKWVYRALRCRSPQRISDLLARVLLREGVDAGSLTLLDLGAGNGCVADELRRIGLRTFVGVDLIPEAASAAERDRPGLYADFAVCDLTEPDALAEEVLGRYTFDAMACVAALGFGDIPPAAFIAAFNRVIDGGWIAFNIKTAFLEDTRPGSFAQFIASMIRDGTLEVLEQETYVHRLNPAGEELLYDAIIGRKRRPVPPQRSAERTPPSDNGTPSGV